MASSPSSADNYSIWFFINIQYYYAALATFFVLFDFFVLNSSISPRLTLRIIPSDSPVNNNDVPPILTNGNGRPVIGSNPTATPIFTIAWSTRAKLSPADNNPPKARSLLVAVNNPLYRSPR